MLLFLPPALLSSPLHYPRASGRISQKVGQAPPLTSSAPFHSSPGLLEWRSSSLERPGGPSPPDSCVLAPLAPMGLLKLPALSVTGPWHRLFPLSGTEALFTQGTLYPLQSLLRGLPSALGLGQVSWQICHSCNYPCIFLMPPSPAGLWGPWWPGSPVLDTWQVFHKYLLNELTNI